MYQNQKYWVQARFGIPPPDPPFKSTVRDQPHNQKTTKTGNLGQIVMSQLFLCLIKTSLMETGCFASPVTVCFSGTSPRGLLGSLKYEWKHQIHPSSHLSFCIKKSSMEGGGWCSNLLPYKLLGSSRWLATINFRQSVLLPTRLAIGLIV